MNTGEMARDHLIWAMGSLDEAKAALAGKDYPRAIRRAQECIELSVKAVLRCLSIEFPREHDVSDVLRELDEASLGEAEFPLWFKEDLPRLADVMEEITPKRGPAMYGFERELRPARGAFASEEGTKAVEDAQFVYDRCSRFLEEWLCCS